MYPDFVFDLVSCLILAAVALCYSQLMAPLFIASDKCWPFQADLLPQLMCFSVGRKLEKQVGSCTL